MTLLLLSRFFKFGQIKDCLPNKAVSFSLHIVRLVNGQMPNEGRLEIFANGFWGTVCDRGWDTKDAAVVCRELGFGPAIEATSGARFGQGTGAIALSNVQCDGMNIYRDLT